MDLVILYGAAAVLVLLLLIVLTKFRRPAVNVDEQIPVRPNIVQRNEAAPPGARRRRNRIRLQAGRQDDSDEEMIFGGDDDDDDDDESYLSYVADPGQKIGAKKRAKLEAKADKKKQREMELEEREERKRRQQALEERRKKEDARAKKEEEERVEKERLEQEEKERREYEEYLAMKEQFSVETEGFEEQAPDLESQSLLEDFIGYIKKMKVVQMEDLASEFKLKTQDVIDRINTLMEDGKLTGIIDDRGKFIYISMDELKAVAKFIKQRGRVSIAELAESSSKLISLTPDIECSPPTNIHDR